MKAAVNKSEPIQSKEKSASNQKGIGSVLQAYKEGMTQLQSLEKEPVQRKPNNTGLPDNLKSGIENLSGYSMDDVKVHYNSSEPATLQAHAYAQGTDIHVAPGQEKHLAHEAWHVVQQKQGRVKPTMQMKGTVPVNDDAGLEKEADVMGAKALLQRQSVEQRSKKKTSINSKAVQRVTEITYNRGAITFWAGGQYRHNQNVGIDTRAYLDPTDPKTGSRTAPGNGIYANGHYNLYQGHLLNANLGGQAITENLFPISPEMNRNHSSQVEDAVKASFLHLNTQKANAVGGWNNRRLFYRVQVQHPNFNDIRPATIANTSLVCTAYYTDNLNPNGNGGVAQDVNLPYINTTVRAPYNLNQELNNIGFGPDNAPTYTVGVHPGGGAAINTRTVLDGAGNTVPNMFINI